jgi:RHS repeat-associated protein
METSAESYEKQMFGQVDANGNPTVNNEWVNTRIPKDPQAAGWSSNTSQMVSKLSKYGYQVGPNALLKVMAGDNIGRRVDYYYDQPTNNPGGGNLLTNLVSNFVNSINVAATTISVHGASTAISSNLQNTTGTGSLQEFIQTQNISSSATPQAYLNVIFFDENFNFVPLGSTADRVANTGSGQSIPMQVSQAPKNGYVFVYVSNESITPVFFDNLEIYHSRGRLVEENTFYPYGLKIAALSSKAFDAPKNLYQYQGDYAEFDEESGYNEFELRDYDAQIGRFVQADPYRQFPSPYIGMMNNPINTIDKDGGWGWALNTLIGAGAGAITGGVIAAIQGGNIFKGAVTGLIVGGAIGVGFSEPNNAFSYKLAASAFTKGAVNIASTYIEGGNGNDLFRNGLIGASSGLVGTYIGGKVNPNWLDKTPLSMLDFGIEGNSFGRIVGNTLNGFLRRGGDALSNGHGLGKSLLHGVYGGLDGFLGSLISESIAPDIKSGFIRDAGGAAFGSISGIGPLTIQLMGVYVAGGEALFGGESLFGKDLKFGKRLGLAGISAISRVFRLDKHLEANDYPFFFKGIYPLLMLVKQN